MKIIIYGWLHHKNRIGLENILRYLNYRYIFTNNLDIDIDNDDVIYSPSNIILKGYTNKIIIGPHISVFPSIELKKLLEISNNIKYIQPSQWVCNYWKQNEISIDTLLFSFAVDTNKFTDNSLIKEKQLVFIYYKHRHIDDLKYVIDHLMTLDIKPIIFDYDRRYNEELYLKVLQNSKYGIVIDAHESQGFAIEEALSCNVPLLVWNVRSMNQEFGQNYPDIPATSIPYWDERCGEFFYDRDDFKSMYNNFIQKIGNYKPREYILENLSVEKCANNFISLLKLFL